MQTWEMAKLCITTLRSRILHVAVWKPKATYLPTYLPLAAASGLSKATYLPNASYRLELYRSKKNPTQVYKEQPQDSTTHLQLAVPTAAKILQLVTQASPSTANTLTTFRNDMPNFFSWGSKSGLPRDCAATTTRAGGRRLSSQARCCL